MLRDGVAVLSLQWLSTSQFQVAMRRIWALKNTTSRDMLDELEGGRSILQEKDEKQGVYKWGATREGVAFWLIGTDRIPAGIVQVASLSANVSDVEVS